MGSQALQNISEQRSYVPRLQPVALDKEFVDDLLNTAPLKIKKFKNELLASEFESDRTRNLLLVGKPGTGKSTLAQALAQASGRLYAMVYAPALGNEYQNSTSQNIERIFVPLFEQKDPCIVVIDEIMSILKNHNENNNPDQKAGEMLWIIMDICAKYNHVTLIATTNSLRKMPDPLKNVFRGSIVEMKLPDWNTRRALIEKTSGQILQLSSHRLWNWHCLNRLRYNSWGWSHRETIEFAKRALKHAKHRTLHTKEPIKITWEDCSYALEDMHGDRRWYFMYNHEIQSTARKITNICKTNVMKKTLSYADICIKECTYSGAGAIAVHHVNSIMHQD